jgi:predicted dehydrogenase
LSRNEIGLGVIGAGGFGLYAMQHFAQIPGVRPVAMAGTHRPAALAAVKRFGIPDIEDVDTLLKRDDVDLVYIATPPFLHHPQSMAALRAGKHVICEKPLAMAVGQADEMIATAHENDRLLVTNLMQRYNPLFDKVGRLIESRVLGEVLHGSFENYASDENLPAEHWFWDRAKSGGIFIEHGVHFFDMFAGWLGEGLVEAARVSVRPGTGLEEQVSCTLRYGDGALVDFYHGFTQAGRMDRQRLHILFERGEVTLSEWIPTTARLHAIVDEEQTRDLCDLFPGARLDISSSYSPKDRHCRARGKDLDVWQMVDLSYGDGTSKDHLYGELLRSMFADQLGWIGDRSHARRMDEENGRSALRLACAADRLAHSGSSVQGFAGTPAAIGQDG